MKLLIVAFSASIHTARWINQIIDQGWEVQLFSSSDSGATNRELKDIRIYHTFYGRKHNRNKKVKLIGVPVLSTNLAFGLRLLLRTCFPRYQQRYLCKVIKKFKPDMIHSMEFQHSAYLVSEVKKSWKGSFPKWIATNWGSDIYWFSRFPKEKTKIEEILRQCDYYSCDCQRDVYLAQKHGLKGKILSVLPGPGGLDLKKIKSWRKPLAQRKIIMLKGYHDVWGRALVGIQALKLCASEIKSYTIIIYSVSPRSPVITAVAKFEKHTGIKVKTIAHNISHEQILKLHGRARLSIGLSVSDGLSNSFLEAMVMGSFPIQSNTSCANEWVESGKTGMIVPPEDPQVIEKAIRRALTDDKLVDEASKQNWKTAQKRLDSKIIKKQIISYYNLVLNDEDK